MKCIVSPSHGGEGAAPAVVSPPTSYGKGGLPEYGKDASPPNTNIYVSPPPCFSPRPACWRSLPLSLRRVLPLCLALPLFLALPLCPSLSLSVLSNPLALSLSLPLSFPRSLRCVLKL